MRKMSGLVVSVALLCGGCNLSNPFDHSDPTLTVVVSPKTQTLAVSTQQQFTATVTGTSSQNVEWSISGTACTPTTDCGTITANGLFTAPATIPNPAEITITATARANTKYSGAAVVTVTSAPAAAAVLRGAYSFLVKGADAEGPFSMGGYFVADGASHLRNGELRVCREESHCIDQSFAGTASASARDTGSFKADILPGTTFFYATAESGAMKLEILGTRGMRAQGVMNVSAE